MLMYITLTYSEAIFHPLCKTCQDIRLLVVDCLKYEQRVQKIFFIVMMYRKEEKKQFFESSIIM